MKPTLFVLAAGMGSRYGGLKQLDGLGPNGETIMDYSIFDALRGGFGKVVFVIRKDFEQDFRDKILSKYEGHIPCELVFQSIDDLPEGFTCPEGRTKPWGTNHAVLMGKDVIKEPFAVINADDFYGRESFAILADYLKGLEGKKNEYCMVGYRVGNTLSESGSVARGVCETNAEKHLTSVVERTQIERRDGKVMFKEGDTWTAIDDNAPVSMNMWGFTRSILDEIKAGFPAFLDKGIKENPMKCEYFLPSVVSDLLAEGRATVRVLESEDKWYGVTYKEDKPVVVAAVQALKDEGLYPQKLWD